MEFLELIINAIDRDFDAIHKLADISDEQGKEELAVFWLEYSCEKNNDDVAMYRLGVKYLSDETSPLYNLAKGNSLLAKSAGLGNNAARVFFAKHIMENAPEKLYERAVRMLIDAADDGVDEAMEILDDFFARFDDVSRKEAWKSTVPFELIKTAADKGSKHAIQLCALAYIGNMEFIVFDEDHYNFVEGVFCLEKATLLELDISCIFYCKTVMMLLDKMDGNEPEKEMLLWESKCNIVFDARYLMLKYVSGKNQYIEFFVKYLRLLSRIIEMYKARGDNEKTKAFAEKLKTVYTAESTISETFFDGIKYFLDAVVFTNGVHINEQQANIFINALRAGAELSQQDVDKLLICYVSYIVFVKVDADSYDVQEAKDFFLMYSDKDSDEYAELMSRLEQKLAE